MIQTTKPKSVKAALDLIRQAYIATERRADSLYSGISNPQIKELYITLEAQRDTLIAVAQMLDGNRVIFNTLLEL